MLILLFEECTQSCVQKLFDQLEEGVALELFRRLFGMFITYNGSEFKNTLVLETSVKGCLQTIFFCYPLLPSKKEN